MFNVFHARFRTQTNGPRFYTRIVMLRYFHVIKYLNVQIFYLVTYYSSLLNVFISVLDFCYKNSTIN
jgi:hypothetical protein